MLGVYVQSSDLDDWSGSCECYGDDGQNKFPATSVIAAGSQGKDAHTLTNCKKFGKPWLFPDNIIFSPKNLKPCSANV